jgi:hypothetical protein
VLAAAQPDFLDPGFGVGSLSAESVSKTRTKKAWSLLASPEVK